MTDIRILMIGPGVFLALAGLVYVLQAAIIISATLWQWLWG